MARFRKTTTIPCTTRELYDWHNRPGAFERLAPPWQSTEVVSRKGGIEAGSEIHIRLKRFGIAKDWIARITESREGKMFEDTQVEGPFASWTHRHEFLETVSGQSQLSDSIEYVLPGGRVGHFVGSRFAETELKRLFRYRHRITRSDLRTLVAFRGFPKWNVLISGGYGFTGRRLGDFLKSQGHAVSVLSRNPREEGDVGWNPVKGELDPDSLEGFDAVIHLAGENLASGRWTEEQKRRIYDSRVNATRLLVETIERLPKPLKAFVCASAVGFYGDCGDRVVSESEGAGNGFLAEVCDAWEGAARQGEQGAEKVVRLRTGIVLDPTDGALSKMLLPFKLGVGGAFGSGRQWMPWIALEDWIGAVHHLLFKGGSGAYNLVSPKPKRNKAFGKTLASVLHRPALLNVRAPLLKIALGEFAEEGLLSSCRAAPKALLDAGYDFRYPELGDALKLVLGRG